MNITAPKSFRVQKEIIMILSSEPEIDVFMQRTFEAIGYPVLTAEKKEQAEDLLKSFNGAIRLLVTDISINEESALGVIASLRMSNQTLEVIVISDEVSPRKRNDINIDGMIELIQKPVEKEDLLRAIRRIAAK